MHIGPYEVLFELARGGMGTVYLARTVGPRGIERLVAIKRAHQQVPHERHAVDRFLDEARITSLVHHANIVGMHNIGTDDEGHYLVFDYVEGESLEGLIARATDHGGRIPLRIIIRVLLDALAGLHSTHEAKDASGRPLGILHRDVSPQNVLVGCDGVTRLADFGIAKSTLSSVVTDEGLVQGKLVYMAPEYLQRRQVDRRVDVYSFGVTMWTSLVGHIPWARSDQGRTVEAILRQGVPDLSYAAPEVAPEIALLVGRACRRDPRERFETARHMHDALERTGRELDSIASHLEVAEYVEASASPDLADRRERIRAHRSGRNSATCASSEEREQPVSVSSILDHQKVAPRVPARAMPSGDGLHADNYVASDMLRRTWERPLPWRLIALIGATAVTIVTAFFLGTSHEATGSPHVAGAPVEAPPALHDSALHEARPRMAGPKSSLSAGEREAEAPALVAPTTTGTSPVEPREPNRKTAPRTRSHQTERFSTTNPYR